MELIGQNEQTVDPHRILVFGHSHVRRLEEFCKKKDQTLQQQGLSSGKTFLNLKLDGQAIVKFHGIGGLTVPNSYRVDFREDYNFHPHTVILLVGGNDIGGSHLLSRERDGIALAENIFGFGQYIRRSMPWVQEVIFKQILPRYVRGRRHRATVEEREAFQPRQIQAIINYNWVADVANKELERLVQGRLGFLYHGSGFTLNIGPSTYNAYKQKALQYLKDGVHLTEEGYNKLFQSVRGTALTSTNRLTRRRH